ncbi:MAG: 2,3-bisphosphoglycerate-independent phosphoglycerate mutase [Patescibacteria group bacterium]
MVNIQPKIKPVVLVILDGWGVAPPSQGNAITLAKTLVFNNLLTHYPAMILQASGEAVGLSWGEMGNSEVGHLNLGAGKIVWQNLPKITRSIIDGSFFKNEVLLAALEHVKKNKSKLHFLGLVSKGMVHSSIDHLFALLELAKQKNIKDVFIHAILDGRDTPFNSGQVFIKELEDKIQQIGVGKIATLSGRYWTMDRDNHWERTEKAYLAMTEGGAEKYFQQPLKAIAESYEKKIYDEEFIPTVITDKNDKPLATISDNDAVIFFNFRPDRARQITKAFVLPEFKNFQRLRQLQNLFFVTMTEYEVGLPVEIAFPPEKIENPLAKIISDNNLKQFHIAETEKYAHVTFFFNGGTEKAFPGEDRVLIPSPRVSSYDQKPEMSAPEVAAKTIEAINSQRYDFIIINFANPDMVGHTGNLEAAKKTVEIVDELLGRILLSVLKVKGAAIVTADHGNIEEMINLRTGEIDKEHSTNPVPFIIVGKDFELKQPLAEVPDLSSFSPAGVLADVAPTILKMMGLPKPAEMIGTALF